MVNTVDTPEADFGARLRGLRERAGLTVRALAADLHRAHSGIVEYEGGRRLPSAAVVEQYEDYFNQPRGALLALRERAVMARSERPRDGVTAAALGPARCPYAGPRAFERGDANLFFGREAQVQAVSRRLASTRFVAVIGASGSGKSSFVGAGLLPQLRAPAAGVVLLTPGRHPCDALAASGCTSPAGSPRATPPARDGRRVIVVDRLEEIFTLCDDDSERRRFIHALLAAWRDTAGLVTLIVVMRSDFRGHLAAHHELAAAVDGEHALIGRMSSHELRRAIELPAAVSGLLLQPGFAETVLEDVGDAPGALALMSAALLETWKRRRRLTLTISGYREIGGVRGAIADTAERTLHALPEADRAVARSIFLRLTDVHERAAPAPLRLDRGDLAAAADCDGATDRVLEAIARARLVTIDGRTVVLAHDALISHWGRLRTWVDAERADLLAHRRLTRAARDWVDLAGDPGALYRGTRLAAAREWATCHRDTVGSLEREFLRASEAAERRELSDAGRSALRVRLLACGAAAMATALAVVVAVSALA